MPNQNHQNQNVLITGATMGIGKELAKLFANDGYNLVIVARHEEDLLHTAQELKKNSKIKVLSIPKDLFQPNAAFEIYEELKHRGIHINILVNNAGHGHYGEFIHTHLETELSIIQLNITSLVILTKLFLQDMVYKGNGKILNTSSIASKFPGPWQAVYHATKAFVQSFTEAIRAEVKDSGVTVTALLPGVTDTDFFNKANMENSKAVQDESKKADPADVAKDGYEALMEGRDMVVSGFNNKVRVAMSNLISDQKLANKTYQDQAPVEDSK
jgi:uncharacterized protein